MKNDKTLLINILPQETDLTELLKAIPAREFCERLGNKKAIQQNSQTRTKKRHIDKIEQALSVLRRLGFKVSLD
jgi:hypothetical protein